MADTMRLNVPADTTWPSTFRLSPRALRSRASSS